MVITVNGKKQEWSDQMTLSELLEQLFPQGVACIAELNGTVICKSDWSETYLNAEDQIEILRLVGGG